MAVSWRLRHEVYRDCAPALDYLALEGERIIGRMFQINHAGNAGQWLWTIMATGTAELPDGPPCGVEPRKMEAELRLVEAYERLVARGDGTSRAAVEADRMTSEGADDRTAPSA